ncbi:hypothetical protein DM800_29070 [Bacillus sp. AY18-3]|uniref:hypothetical protein n=1 Tax=Bacillus sp. AY18-3 TaxID=2217814 RepID=UPI0011C83494|nr:hypothetical protein [Bacillus sp. AY18-3]TXR59013.1 hypothetical protein DM800_29070 [Bacillus sp. AY18-3]
MNIDCFIEFFLVRNLDDVKGKVLLKSSKRELVQEGIVSSNWKGLNLGDRFELIDYPNKNDLCILRVMEIEDSFSSNLEKIIKVRYVVVVHDENPESAIRSEFSFKL